MIRNRPKNMRFVYTREDIDDFIRNPDAHRRRLKWEGVRVIDEAKRIVGKRDPRGGNKDLVIVAKEDIPDILERMYNDPATGLQGRDKLIAKVYEHYIGISKEDVSRYLHSNQTHEIHTTEHKQAINKPIVVSKPFRYYQMDLTNWWPYAWYNRGNTYLLSLVDLHSKMLFAEPIKTKESEDVLVGLKAIVQRLPTKPAIIQSDNGSEFLSVVKEWLKKQGIRQVFSKSHTPQSQGAIERVQGNLKKMIKRYMVLNNTRRWIDIGHTTQLQHQQAWDH